MRKVFYHSENLNVLKSQGTRKGNDKKNKSWELLLGAHFDWFLHH